MKLLLTITFLALLYSCESEYHMQMVRARKLVRTELRIKASLQAHFSPESVKALQQIREDIAFHAHLSGNEAFFMQELNGFKSDLQPKMISTDRLISKYP